MRKTLFQIEKYLLIVALTASCYATVGCEYLPESTFELASASRLPKWITLPPEHTRADVKIMMSYYDSIWGNDTMFILQDINKHMLAKVYGKRNRKGPFHLKHPPQGYPPGYPLYEIITVNGITEIIEHKKMEPIFYVTDNPIVWNELMGVQPQASGSGQGSAF